MGDEHMWPPLTSRQLGRYQRQMVLPGVGLDGQRRLLASRVLVIGAGALGSAAATYLAAAGVGTLGLVDGDTVELSNLHRQILHDTLDVGRSKTASGAERLRSLNPDVTIVEHSTFLSSANALDIFRDYDLVVNGSDNFPARYLVNDAAVMTGKPLVDAAILRFEGQLAVFRPGFGCYRCLFPAPPPPGAVPDCAQAGVFGALAGVMGSMQAVEALKILLGLAADEPGRFMIYDALASNWYRMPLNRDRACPVCGEHPTVTALIDYEAFCGIGESAVPAEAPSTRAQAVSIAEAQALLQDPGVSIIDVREAHEFAAGHIPGATNIPLEQLDRLASTHDPQKPLLVVCAAGVRSAYGAEYLESRGFKAWTLSGGFSHWQASGQDWTAT